MTITYLHPPRDAETWRCPVPSAAQVLGYHDCGNRVHPTYRGGLKAYTADRRAQRLYRAWREGTHPKKR